MLQIWKTAKRYVCDKFWVSISQQSISTPPRKSSSAELANIIPALEICLLG
jgi:hypothetical protein